MTRVERHLQVERDILDLAEWIARGSREAAFRFMQNAEDTMSSLGQMPGKGSPKHLRHRRLKNVRSWAVAGFPKHLILYQVKEGTVLVLAVVHGARRYSRLLQQRVSQ